MGLDERIEELEEKLEETPVNKATETERARLKSQIAKLKEEKQQKQKSTGDTSGYAVRKRGDATVALVGFPSVGKSSLLNSLTNTEVDTGAYEFTTLEVHPGMMKHRGANIQILDVPGLIGGAADGRGDGTQVLSVVRNADLVLIVLDPGEMRYDEITSELYDAGIRIDTEPPRMKIEKKGRGGINISATADLEMEEDTVRQLMKENGYTNAEVIIREEMDVDRFIDGLMENRKYVPSVTAVNKADTLQDGRREELEQEYDLLVSAETGEGIEELKDQVFKSMDLIRIYMKEKGEEPDRDDPLILREGATVADVLEALPGDMVERFKDAKVTGESAQFPEQKVGQDHELADKDVVRLNLKRI
ncbi:MAG: OBG GTPase family GTP-binding protein [Candidatus Nanohaloarchaea archaeon]